MNYRTIWVSCGRCGIQLGRPIKQPPVRICPYCAEEWLPLPSIWSELRGWLKGWVA